MKHRKFMSTPVPTKCLSLRSYVMKVIAALILLEFGTFYSYCKVAHGENPEQMLKPLVAISGADSSVRLPSFERIATAKGWTSVWVRHLGTTTEDAYRPRLEVDFDRCLVVVIFRGERQNVRGIQVGSLRESTDSIILRFEELTYQTEQTAQASNQKARPPALPYAFVILSKTSKPIILEEGTRQYINEPPTWRVCARLEGAGPAAPRRHTQ
jgi:hypothetical protein